MEIGLRVDPNKAKRY